MIPIHRLCSVGGSMNFVRQLETENGWGLIGGGKDHLGQHSQTFFFLAVF